MGEENTAIEYEILCNEAQAIILETQGMRFENEQRIMLNESLAYTEESFIEQADKLRNVSKKLKTLQN